MTHTTKPPLNAADLSDHKLLRALRDESLDKETSEAVLREARRRRVEQSRHPASPSRPASASPTAAPVAAEDYAFGTDRFADNPYQPPQSPAPPGTLLPTRTRIVNALWWLHIGLLALFTLKAIYTTTVSASLRLAPLGLVAVLVLCVIGMVGWRLQRALLHRWIWGLLGVGALLYTVVLTLGVIGLWFVGTANFNMSPLELYARSSAALLMAVALTWGLTRYAFRSRSLW